MLHSTQFGSSSRAARRTAGVIRCVVAMLAVLCAAATPALSSHTADPNDHWYPGFYGPGSGSWEAGIDKIVVLGSDVYATSREFDHVTTASSRVLKWDGHAWSRLGGRFTTSTFADGYITSLAVFGGELYVCGSFTGVDGVAAKSIARWNGSTWTPVGSGDGGFDGYVVALTVKDSALYAAGTFTTADYAPAMRIAKWNGSAWSALGSGLSHDATALAVYGTDLVVGGYFNSAGGVAANR